VNELKRKLFNEGVKNNSDRARVEFLEDKVKYFDDESAERLSKIISLEDDSKRLREALYQLLNDCINFDGGKLSDCKMRQAQQALIDTEGIKG
jgi:hypothetical protein